MDLHDYKDVAENYDRCSSPELCGYEVLDIYRGYLGDKEDLGDPMSAAKYGSNLIWILRKK